MTAVNCNGSMEANDLYLTALHYVCIKTANEQIAEKLTAEWEGLREVKLLCLPYKCHHLM